MERKIFDGEYWFRIIRNDKYLINLHRIDIKKFQNEWDNVTYILDLEASDNKNVFSFFGKNGAGKTTLCNQIIKSIDLKSEEIKIINIKEMLNYDFSSTFPFVKKIKNEDFIFFHEYFSSQNRKIWNIIKDVFNKSSNELLNESDIAHKYNEININIEKWVNEFNIELDLKSFHSRGKTNIYMFIKELENYATQNNIEFGKILYNKNLETEDSTSIINIFKNEKYGIEIINFFRKCFKKINTNKNRCKKIIKENNKNIEVFKELKPEFHFLYKDLFKDIIIEKKYNSFLDIEYNEILILNKKEKRYPLHKFLNYTSEGEKKLIKLFFILTYIKQSANNKTIVIADDVFDSFDNKNVVNTIDLLNNFCLIKKPVLLLFTHDIEIFRVLNKRMKIDKECSYMITRKDTVMKFKAITIKEGTLEEYIQNFIEQEIPVEIKSLYLLCLLVYGRNLVERTFGMDKKYYLKITSLMHIKKDSKKILNKLKIFNKLFFMNIFSKKDILEIQEKTKNFNDYFLFLEHIYEYTKHHDLNDLELNIFFSLYGRILIENTILNKLKDKNIDIKKMLSGITSDQTGALITEYKNNFNVDKKENEIILLNNYITKFIHVNHGLSYLINIDRNILYNLIENVKKMK